MLWGLKANWILLDRIIDQKWEVAEAWGGGSFYASVISDSEKTQEDLMSVIRLYASAQPNPQSQLNEFGVSIFAFLIIWCLKKQTPSARKSEAGMQENQDWHNRGSGVEGRGGAVIVSGKMVWQQLIRLAKLWLPNKHPPLWQPSHHAVSHEHTLTRFSIASLRRNQIKEQIIRMEPKHKTG